MKAKTKIRVSVKTEVKQTVTQTANARDGYERVERAIVRLAEERDRLSTFDKVAFLACYDEGDLTTEEVLRLYMTESKRVFEAIDAALEQLSDLEMVYSRRMGSYIKL